MYCLEFIEQTIIEYSKPTSQLFGFLNCKLQNHDPSTITDQNELQCPKDDFNQETTKLDAETEQNITAFKCAKAEDVLSISSQQDYVNLIEEDVLGVNNNNSNNIPPTRNKTEYAHFHFGPKLQNYVLNYQKHCPLFENPSIQHLEDFKKLKIRQLKNDNEENDTGNSSDGDVDDEDSDEKTVRDHRQKKKNIHFSRNRHNNSPVNSDDTAPSSKNVVVPARTKRKSLTRTQIREINYLRANFNQPIYYKDPVQRRQTREPLSEIIKKHAKLRFNRNESPVRVKQYSDRMRTQRKRPVRTFKSSNIVRNYFTKSKHEKVIESEDSESSNTSSIERPQSSVHHSRKRERRKLSKVRVSAESIGDSVLITSFEYNQAEASPVSSASYIDYTEKYSTESVARMENDYISVPVVVAKPKPDKKTEVLQKLIHLCSDEGRPLLEKKGEKRSRVKIQVMNPADREAYDRLKSTTVRQMRRKVPVCNIDEQKSKKRIENIYDKTMEKDIRLVSQRYKKINDKSSKASFKCCKNCKLSRKKLSRKQHDSEDDDDTGSSDTSSSSDVEEYVDPKDDHLNVIAAMVLGSTPHPTLERNAYKKYLLKYNNTKFSKDISSLINYSAGPTTMLVNFYPQNNNHQIIMCSGTFLKPFCLNIQSKLIVFDDDITILNNLLKLNDSSMIATYYFNPLIFNKSEEMAQSCLKNYLRRKGGKYMYRRKYRKNCKAYLLYK